MTTNPDEQDTRVGVLDRIRSNPTGRLSLKIGVGILGGIVVAAGLVMIPFPGPGWAVVILGLAIWAMITNIFSTQALSTGARLLTIGLIVLIAVAIDSLSRRLKS